MAAIFVLAESTLRWMPSLLPKGHYGSGQFDEELGLNVHGSTALHNKVRFVRRVPNRAGFMDVDHVLEKTPGVLRVGFFGDSYVEAIQVPLESTFFRLLSKQLGADRIETFSLGISGWATLHSLMAYQVFGDQYGLDVVVYAFVANDPGDNSYSIQSLQAGGMTPTPAAVVADNADGFEIRWPNDPDSLSAAFRVGKWLQRRSLLVQLIFARIQLLRSQGITLNSEPMASKAGESTGSTTRAVNQNDLPSDWPPETLHEARLLTRRIIERFAESVRDDGRQFLVLYVPRGNDEVEGDLPVEDSWLPWLRETTADLGIPLLDPTSALETRQRTGTLTYDDHWSPAGHEVIAEFLADSLCNWLATLSCEAPEMAK